MARLTLGPAQLVLFMGFAVLLFNSGARFSLGLMLPPMVADLGWSRTTLSAVVTVFMILTASALPFTGKLVDRFGAMRILLFGVVVSAVAITLMGWIKSPWQAFVCYGFLFALGSAATSITPVGVLLSKWYPDRLGMANSVAISGMGVGQLLVIGVLSAQLASIGWRGSFIWLGVAILVFVLPLLALSSRAKLPATVTSYASQAPEQSNQKSSTLHDALRARRLWIVLVIYAICGFQDFLIATHIVALALDQGVSSSLSGNMLALMGLAGLVGVLLAGWVNDRTGPIWPTALTFVIRIVLFALIVVSQHPFAIIAAGLGFGFTFWITAPLTVVFAKAYCAPALLGTVSGLITMVHHGFGGLGAIYAAQIFDRTGTYQLAMITMLIISVAGLVLSWWLSRLGNRAEYG